MNCTMMHLGATRWVYHYTLAICSNAKYRNYMKEKGNKLVVEVINARDIHDLIGLETGQYEQSSFPVYYN